MVFTRRAAEPVAGDGYGLPDPFPREHSTIDALRRALQMESVRQEAIAAEIAEQRELEDEVRRELGLFREGPSRNPARFQPVVLPHGGDTFPAQDDELWSGKAMPMQTGASAVRRPAKGRVEEWYQPPWHNTTEDEDGASFSVSRLPKKSSSGRKRQRSAETFQTNSKKLCVQRSYARRQVNTDSEVCFEEYSASRRHESNIAALESIEESIVLKRKIQSKSLSVTRHYPTIWNCGICQANCSRELDLKDHLRGRRHQENLEALQRGCYTMKEDNELTLPLRKNHNSTWLWICSICQAKCDCESDIWSHLRGKRHQENTQALKRKAKEIEAKLYEKEVPQLAEKIQKFVPRWSCSICKANCTSESDLEHHFRGRRHQQNLYIKNSNRATLHA